MSVSDLGRYPLRLSVVLAAGLAAAGMAGRSSPERRLDSESRRASNQPSASRTDSIRWVALSAGDRHTCALAAGGEPYCWGEGFYYQIGDGARTDRRIPAPVAGQLPLESLTAGTRLTCGVTSTGAAVCWGSYAADDDGSPIAANRGLPLTVPGAIRFRSLAIGGAGCGLGYDDTPYCVLGRRSPPEARGDLRFQSLSAGHDVACGLTREGAVHCWNLDYADAPIVSLAGAPRFSSIGVKGSFGCGVTAAGAAHCWQMSPPTFDNGAESRATLSAVPGGIRFRSLAVGSAFACGLATDSLAYCWGRNDQGQLGDRSNSDRSAPAAVAGGLRFLALVAGGEHACGLTARGAAYCWGANYGGQLGDGSMDDRTAPVRVRDPDSAYTADESRSLIVLPARRDTSRSYPALVLFPFTYGTAAGLWERYGGIGHLDPAAAPNVRRLASPLEHLAPAGTGGEGGYVVVLAPGIGSPGEYSSGEAWAATIARYERRVLDDLDAYITRYRLDPERIVLGGFSMGGDLAWAISLRNPDRFRGAIVMGSRASYRLRAVEMTALARRQPRYYFALGTQEDPERLAGARAAATLLERHGVAFRYEEIPRAGHEPAPLPMFTAALDFVLWRR
ncbi:MAG: alpha/beta fold hydrolase [Gemmatimonadota bacterium]